MSIEPESQTCQSFARGSSGFPRLPRFSTERAQDGAWSVGSGAGFKRCQFRGPLGIGIQEQVHASFGRFQQVMSPGQQLDPFFIGGKGCVEVKLTRLERGHRLFHELEGRLKTNRFLSNLGLRNLGDLLCHESVSKKNQRKKVVYHHGRPSTGPKPALFCRSGTLS